MTKITLNEIRKLAQMSQLDIPEHELEALCHDLDAVLTYASGLQDIAQRAPAVKVLPKNQNIFREDVVLPTNPEPITAQAPAGEENYFVVPKIIKQS